MKNLKIVAFLLVMGIAFHAHSATQAINDCGLSTNHFGNAAGTSLSHTAINNSGETWNGATWFQCDSGSTCPAGVIENPFISYSGPGSWTLSEGTIDVTGLNIAPGGSYTVTIGYGGTINGKRTQIDPVCLSELPAVPTLGRWEMIALAVLLGAGAILVLRRHAIA